MTDTPASPLSASVAASPPPNPPTPAGEGKGGGIWRAMTIVLLLALCGLGGFYGWREGMIHLPQPQQVALPVQDDTLAHLQETLAQQDARIAELSQQMEEMAQAPAVSSEALAALEARLQTAERALQAASERQSAAVQAVIAFEDMRRAASSGQPYEQEWELFASLASGDDDVWQKAQKLEVYAQEGIATDAVLRKELARAIRRTSQGTANKDDSFVQQVGQNLSSLVTIRKVGAAHEGTDDASRIARAEAFLGKGDIAAAIAEIDALSEQGRDDFARFLRLARAHQRAHAVLDEVSKELRRAVTAPSGDAAP